MLCLRLSSISTLGLCVLASGSLAFADVKPNYPTAPAPTAPAASEQPVTDAPKASPVPIDQTPPTAPTNPAPSPAISKGPTDVQTAQEFKDLDPHIKITKVHTVENNPSYKAGSNRALEFEKKYWNYGAILDSEKKALEGQIYVLSWRNSGPADHLQARFEYRQVKTKDQIRSQTVDFPVANGSTKTTFKVVGEDYSRYGPVYSWRMSILRGEKIVAVERSYIW